MALEFPLHDVETSLGIVPEPIIPVELLTQEGYCPFDFLLDTGADCSMLPASMADLLGIVLKQGKKAQSVGIEGRGVLVYIHLIKVKIGNVLIQIKCLFSLNETTPFILGRHGIFSHFNILFDNKHKKIKLIKI